MTPSFVRVEREEAKKKNTWWQVLVFYILDYPGGTLSLALATNHPIKLMLAMRNYFAAMIRRYEEPARCY
jgi:hypothetical protein